jgi:hypothetical protein
LGWATFWLFFSQLIWSPCSRPSHVGGEAIKAKKQCDKKCFGKTTKLCQDIKQIGTFLAFILLSIIRILKKNIKVLKRNIKI